MKEKNEKDSTIISIPYGSKLKTEFSGASDVISGKVLENVPVQHLSNALSGRISGLTTIQRSGEPGNDEAESDADDGPDDEPQCFGHTLPLS